MIVSCRYCKTQLTLNADSPEARKQGTDPHQQMRRHIERYHALEIMKHSRKMGWLMDYFFFTSEDPQFRKDIDDLVTHFLADNEAEL